jgi:hypothetical protein
MRSFRYEIRIKAPKYEIRLATNASCYLLQNKTCTFLGQITDITKQFIYAIDTNSFVTCATRHYVTRIRPTLDRHIQCHITRFSTIYDLTETIICYSL